ncbi:hypothetical protein HanPSC8_Chr16g0706571 [Helianthus annuus]|nr:hypothetical protein HanPSC8_Chr16g0706571 [Helianthus annuus]
MSNHLKVFDQFESTRFSVFLSGGSRPIGRTGLLYSFWRRFIHSPSNSLQLRITTNSHASIILLSR